MFLILCFTLIFQLYSHLVSSEMIYMTEKKELYFYKNVEGKREGEIFKKIDIYIYIYFLL